MAQTEICVVTCDGELCDSTFKADDWEEVHEIGYQLGWRFTPTRDLCRDCRDEE